MLPTLKYRPYIDVKDKSHLIVRVVSGKQVDSTDILLSDETSHPDEVQSLGKFPSRFRMNYGLEPVFQRV